MTDIKIKKEFADTAVGFGESCQPLGKRNDLDQLAIMALQANDQFILNMFESIPTLQELQEAKAGKISAAMKEAIAAPKPEAKETK